MLMEPQTKAELDVEPFHECSDSIAPLFHKESLGPSSFRLICGGVIFDNIAVTDLSKNVHHKDRDILKRKFREIMSHYGTLISPFEVSGPGTSKWFAYFAGERIT